MFVRDLVARATVRVNVANDGTTSSYRTERPTISADGRYIAFESQANFGLPGASSYIDVFVKDRVSGNLRVASVGMNGAAANSQSGQPALSADGRSVAFYSYATNLVTGDTNSKVDVFVQRH